jgi:hypothetical protein
MTKSKMMRHLSLQKLSADRGAAILVMTVILAFVILGLSTTMFRQAREQRHRSLETRAKINARYCSEYAVARYALPEYLQNPELHDLGNTRYNWIQPSVRTNIMDEGSFQAEDNAFRFTFHADSLMMEKIYDNVSKKPYHFVSAQGIVSWREGSEEYEVKHRSSVAMTFNDFSRFMYFSNGEFSPEGRQVNFYSADVVYGRVHINGQMSVTSNTNTPTFHGFFSQTAESVLNLTQSNYESVFQGGYWMPAPEIEWPPNDAIEQIKSQADGYHVYDASININGYDQPLTTLIKVRGRRYHVAQVYSDSLIWHADPNEPPDTIYVQQNDLDWTTKLLPTQPGHELVYVKGVCRIEGIVDGAVTFLSSDTMFIMDNIITSDTELNRFGEDYFGKIPIGSHRRIGLASENNIIIASTLPNGFGDGDSGPNVPCCLTGNFAPPSSNIGNINAQGRKDIIITAAIFAVGCSFGAEFWNTTAWDAPGHIVEAQPDVDLCGPYAWTHLNRWGRPGSTPCCTPLQVPNVDDRRGTIYLHGSVVQTHRGYVQRNPPGQLDPATIGYADKVYRYDDNFISGGPPVWFRVKYSDGSQAVTTEMVVSDYDRWMENRENAGVYMAD